MTANRLLGHYRLDRVLGTGSFATVWLAHDEVLDRNVAIKVLADNWSRDLDVRRRFLSEASVLLNAESPRITRAFELGETADEHPYLVMMWADRGTLTERIAARRSKDEGFAAHEAASIVREIALALADVHALGHLHRDVKPSNVLIRSAPATVPVAGIAPDEQLVIGDFGLARGIDASAITLVAGSPGYVAPEQAGGLTRLDARADLYPLGRIMLELLAGDPGGRATTMAAAATERIDVPELLAEHGVVAPAALIALTGELLCFERDGRPVAAADVAARLEPFTRAGESGTSLGSNTAAAAGDTDGDTVERRRITRRPTVVTTALLALVLIGVATLMVLRDGRSPEASPTTAAARSTGVTPDSSAVVASVDGTTPAPPTLSLPAGAARDNRASDESRTVATIALGVDQVVAFFRAPRPPWEVVDGPTTSGDSALIVLAAPSRRATVTVTPAAVTAGEGISRIVIDYK